MLNRKELASYIKTSLARGKSKEEIYKNLLNEGCSVDAIQEGFDVVTSEREREDTSKRTIRIIVTFGAVLVGVGIFSFIAANWQAMAKSVKIFIIIAAMLASYAAGWQLKEKMNFSKTGGALILLGTIIYGGGIFLVAQMFHIRAHWPDGFILWMIGAVAVAYALESYPVFYLAILVGSVAIFGHPFALLREFGFHSFLLTSSLLLFVATITTFLIGWAMRKKVPPELREFY
ncbi:DUF2157 domain-containing protein [Candidatus Parcubacteria bacterium]|nr:MAG: DUF2157 domain-containing protein [Candidatus Parcubacteria bacterium]